MSDLKRVLIIDDHTLIRDGYKSILERSARFEVVGEAGSYSEGLLKFAKLKPDVAIVDISLPGGSGIELTREIKQASPSIAVIIVSMHSKIEFIAASFQAGAAGYLAKESTSERFIQALETVTRGEQYLDSAISPKVVLKLVEYSSRKARSMNSSYGELTQREQQIMRMLAEGMTTKQIADKVYITRKTVENHRTTIMNKLEIKTPVELVRQAVRLGLIDIDTLQPAEDSGD